MTSPAPLTGLTGFVVGDPFASPEERHGGTADPRHDVIGETNTPYPWEEFPGETHGPYGLENGLFDMDIALYVEPAGHVAQDPTMDETPVRGHAAPWPKGLVQSPYPDDGQADKRLESADIHASNMGGSREQLYIPTANPVQDEWVELLETDPGVTFPAMEPIPGQIKTGGSGGYGSTDRIQSYARQNSYGFDSAHMHRRYAAGSIPGNYMWLEPGGRPLVKSIPGAAKIPVGVDSPFHGQDPGRDFDAQGATLMQLPTSYQAPPDPALAPVYVDSGVAEVSLW